MSAFVFGGVPERALKKAFENADIYVSAAILKEYREVPLLLEKEGKINHQQLKALIYGIAAFIANAKIIGPAEKLEICRDPKDNILLECCLAAGADVLITGDNDLLGIKDLPFRLSILTPRKYIEEI